MNKLVEQTNQIAAGSSRPELLLPKMVSVVREGYSTALLRADFIAAATVAIVALPLSMAIAIASGVGPERGWGRVRDKRSRGA